MKINKSKTLCLALLSVLIGSVQATTFNSLNFYDAIKIVKGNGKRQLAVFSDPNCMPSNKYQVELEKLKDVTIHIFVVPLKGQDSIKLSQGILCSSNPKVSWSAWMIEGKKPPQSSCNTVALERNIPLFEKVGAQATPFTIFADDSIIDGAAPASEIERRLNSIYGNTVEKRVSNEVIIAPVSVKSSVGMFN